MFYFGYKFTIGLLLIVCYRAPYCCKFIKIKRKKCLYIKKCICFFAKIIFKTKKKEENVIIFYLKIYICLIVNICVSIFCVIAFSLYPLDSKIFIFDPYYTEQQ